MNYPKLNIYLSDIIIRLKIGKFLNRYISEGNDFQSMNEGSLESWNLTL